MKNVSLQNSPNADITVSHKPTDKLPTQRKGETKPGGPMVKTTVSPDSVIMFTMCSW